MTQEAKWKFQWLACVHEMLVAKASDSWWFKFLRQCGRIRLLGKHERRLKYIKLCKTIEYIRHTWIGHVSRMEDGYVK